MVCVISFDLATGYVTDKRSSISISYIRFREVVCYRLKAESCTVSFSLSFFCNII